LSLLGALLRDRDPVEERTINSSDVPWSQMEGYFGPAGVNVDRDSMLGVSAVWACVSLISDSIATLPVKMYAPGVDGAADQPLSDPPPGWLEDPNPEQTIVDFKFGTVASLLLHGNAYVYLVRDRKMNIVEAWILDPRWVQVRREYQPDGSLALNYYVQVGKGMQSPVGPFKVPAGPDMFHIMAFQPNSSWPMGISPLDNARMMWGAAIAGQEMGTRWFSQGFNAAGVIETADDMTLEQAKGIKQGFADANTGGPRKMHYPPVLTGGASWKQIQISPEQAQFLQQRQFAVDEIARWFRVPPHMIGNLEKTTSWGSGIEEQTIGFVKFTCRPWIERIEHAWNRHMMVFEKGRFLRFDTKAFERGNLVNQADFFTKMHGIGMVTANEGRGELGLPPFDGGDEHYFPVNTAPVGTEPVTPIKDKIQIGENPAGAEVPALASDTVAT
jgi:HK97 family phage portal protein